MCFRPRGQTPQLPECQWLICPGVDHVEEEVQVRVLVEAEKGEQGIGATHGKEQGEEQRERTDDQSTAKLIEICQLKNAELEPTFQK